MTRRDLLFAAAGFPGVAYRDYSRCLPDYLRGLAARAYEARNREIAKLTTPAAIRKRQAWARETLWKLIGGMPERTPLNARTAGSFDRDGYRVEKVIYESRPKFFIPANLYIPKTGKPPYPGVLFQMGHSLNGKAADSYQSCCQGLVKLGYLVLAFDPMGQGERVYYPGSSPYRTRLSSADAEHTVPGKQMLLYGDTSTQIQLWDAVRSLDYLAAHPLVDPKRLASTGQSGGATLTMLLVAVDDRLAAAAEMSGNTENVACANYDPPGSTDDAEQDFIDSGPAGFDRWDLFYPFAPKPMLVGVSDKDFFGTYSPSYISSGWEEYQKLAKVYQTLGAHDALAWNDTPLPHGLSYDSRLAVYNFFQKHLKNGEPVKEEPPVTIEPDRELLVTESGSVLRSLGSETPFSMNRARKVQRQPIALQKLLRVDPPPARTATVLKRVPSRGCDLSAIEISSAPGVWLPAWLYTPRTPDASKPLFLALEPAGRNVRWHERELYQSLASAGWTVCVPDVRGIGDLAPEFGRGAPRHTRGHQDEEDYSWGSMILGRPLLGQRITDILAAVGGKRALVAAGGRLAVPALFATAMEPRIEGICLAGSLISYQSVVNSEEYSTPFSLFSPGLLNHTDLPEVAASIAPRRLVLAGVVKASGDPAPVEEVHAAFPKADVRPQTAWDALVRSFLGA